MADANKELLDYLSSIEIFDTHEHLPPYEEVRAKNTDILKEYMAQYFGTDMISAGLPVKEFEKMFETSIPLMDRWIIAEKYWNICRYTGHGRALDLSVRELYSIDQINRETIEELNAQFQKSLEPGHYKKVLKEVSKIRISINDRYENQSLDCDKEFFKSACHLDHFIAPSTKDSLVRAEVEGERRVSSFDNWLLSCEKAFNKAFEKGAVCIKIAHAYSRTLKHDLVTRQEAERGFHHVFDTVSQFEWQSQVQLNRSKAFEDYMVHFILSLANESGYIVQIHTGIQGLNGNNLDNANPIHLNNLFLRYPNVKFDIFHIGYPFQHILSALAKSFPNVYIDMCWAHIISPTASINALREWIDSVPLNKISAFGGDYCIIDAIVGHQKIARENVSRALSEAIFDGVFDINEAKKIGKMLLHDNPSELFEC
ncbi:MAG: amidohydrolase family protein [Desulfobacterales bacterium]|nr:amidohydrolase family protein [Desulfobacterales bacterium]